MSLGVAGDGSEEHRAVSFGRNALTYDSYRPTTPSEAVAHMIEAAEPRDAVEVGAGTGLTTRKVARDGLALLCLEPSSEMADVLRRRDLPGVRVEETTFEAWIAPEETTDLIYAVQAWHWVDRDIGYTKARTLLRPGGVLALIWNIPTARLEGLADVYRTCAPELVTETDERVRRRDSHDWGADMAAAGFDEVWRHTQHWSRELDGSAYRALMSTNSDHILLEEDRRTRLLDAIEQHIADSGDTIVVEYRTEVFFGRR